MSFILQLDTPTPRRGAPPRRTSLCLGKLDDKFSEFSGPPRHSNALPRRTSLPRRSSASLRLTYKSCFGFSLQLILTSIHWINEDPNNELCRSPIAHK